MATHQLVLKHTKDVLQGMAGSKILTNRRPKRLRASGVPYCPVLDYMNPSLSELEYREYNSEYYMEVGTTVHTLFQNFIHTSEVGWDRVVGDWKCNKCGLVKPFDLKPTCALRETESVCKLGYEELELFSHSSNKFKKSLLSGHVDLVTVLPTKEFVVWDFKTTSLKALEWRKVADGKHIHQLSIYCWLIEKFYGVVVSHLVVVYVPRDTNVNRNGEITAKSYPYAWTDERRKLTKKRISRWQKGFKAVEDGYVEELVRLRPCKSKKDFTEEMECNFKYDGGTCSMLPMCCKSDNHLVKALNKRKVLKDYKKDAT